MSSAMNMGFKDEYADDRKGGWTDQGPDNRLSGISVARGAIALQSEGGAIQFRNVWVEERAGR